MAILEHLEELRNSLATVETVAYLDLGSTTVLGKSSALNLPQERLDALCLASSELLGGADGEAEEAVLLRATEAIVLRRAPGARSEALCLVCDPESDIAAVVMGARSALEQPAG